MSFPANGAWSRVVNDEEANFLESHETRIGTSVGVLDGRKRSGRGRVGTIERTYGHPNYLAIDVRFEDGSVEHYWYHAANREAAALAVKRLDRRQTGG